MTAISTSGLTKFYGSTPGIVDLDLEVPRGQIFGFLGPNGAGKTTTIRTLLDFLHPTRGSATILGFDSRRDSVEVRRRVGYLPGELAMYDDMTAAEMIRYFAALRGFDSWSAVEALAERFELGLHRRIGSYSSGNRQKVGIVQAFMHEPELLVLDEPSAGLDPLMQQEFYALLTETAAEGRTVFLSSHILPEVERVADAVGIVRRSRLVAVEEVDALKALARRRVELVFTGAVDPKVFSPLEGVVSSEAGHGNALHLVVEGSMDAVVKEAARFDLRNIVTNDADLEEVFLAYYEEEPAT